MTEPSVASTPTVLDSLVESLIGARSHNHSAEIAPVAVLWPDPAGEWRALVPRLSAMLPFLTLGEYKPEESIGPAAWICCVVARALEGIEVGDIPIVYLPGWSVRRLHAVADYERALAPLAELQFRSSLWLQPDGREWSIAAFLQRKDCGLGIDIHGGSQTHEAMVGALVPLADQRIDALRAEAPLKVTDFEGISGKGPGPTPDDLRALIARGESANLEFKSSLRFNLETRNGDERVFLQGPIKSIAAFMNSQRGGTLLVGVADDGTPLGLDSDLSLFPKDKRNLDQLELWFWSQIFKWFGGKGCAPFIRISFPEIDGKHIVMVSVTHGNAPTFVLHNNQETFYLRSGNRTDALSPREMLAYVKSAWG